MEHLFGNNKKILAKDEDQGAHTLATRVGARLPPPGCATYLVGYQDYFLAPLPGSIALFFESLGIYIC